MKSLVGRAGIEGRKRLRLLLMVGKQEIYRLREGSRCKLYRGVTIDLTSGTNEPWDIKKPGSQWGKIIKLMGGKLFLTRGMGNRETH